jgi:arylsulfatase A-like enzyme
MRYAPRRRRVAVHRRLLVAVVTAGVLLAALVTWLLVTPKVSGPNVVLVIGCTVRKDQIGPYGGPAGVTPFLQGVADRGALFADAIVASPWTKTGTTAVVTGQHPIAVGLIQPSGRGNNRALSDRVTTLAELFRAAGYTTHGGTANPNANAVFGFDQGFDDYYEGSWLWRDGGVLKVRGTEMVDRTVGFLGERSTHRPFYLQLLLVDAHEPRDAPRELARTFTYDGAPLRVGRYRLALQVFDHAVRHLHESLGAVGYDETNTVFVVVSDHGEGLRWPPHHGGGHGVYTFSSTVEMPWIVWGSGVAKGHVVGGLASQVDVAPTVLALAGVEGYLGPGRDWSAQVRGESTRTTRGRAFVDTFFNDTATTEIYTDDVACHEAFSMGTARRRLRPERYTGCYNRHEDRLALQPLESGRPDLVSELRVWREEQWAHYQAWPDVRDAEIGDALSRQLEALGYVVEDP